MTAGTSAPRDLHQSTGPAPSGPTAGDRLAIAVPALVAAGLGLIGITARSLGFDEAATATIAAQHGSALGSAIAHDGGNMSGYYLLIHLLIGAFGNGTFLLRLPSVVAITAATAVVAAIGRRLFDRRVAFAAGLLAAVSLPLVFWAQSARGYAAMVAFVSAAFLVEISLVTAGTSRLGRSRHPDLRRWSAFVVLMTLATYCSYVAVLVVPVQILVLLPRDKRGFLRPFAASLAAYLLLCVPLIVLAVDRGSGQLFWVPRPSHKVDVQVLEALTSSGLQPSFHRTATTVPLLILTLVALIAIAAWWLYGWRTGAAPLGAPAPATTWGLGLLLAWFAVPVAITFVYSVAAQPLFQPRNLLMCVPAGSLLLGAGLAHPRLPRLLAPALLVALIALRALQVGAAYGVSPEPWRQVTAYVHAHARPRDCIAFYPEDARMAFQYYVGTGARAEARMPRSILPVVAWGQVTPYVERYATLSPDQISRRAAGCRRLWFVTSHEGQPDGGPQSLVHMARFHQLRARLEQQFGTAPVRQFGYAAAIHVQLLPGLRALRVSGSSSGK